MRTEPIAAAAARRSSRRNARARSSRNRFPRCPGPRHTLPATSRGALRSAAPPGSRRPSWARPAASFALEVLRHLGIAEQPVDPAALVETFVGDELQFCRIFRRHPPRDLLLEICGVGPQRLEHVLFVLAEQRLYEHRRVPEIRRHAHLGDADEMACQRLVVDVAAHQDRRQRVADLLADSQQPDRAAFGGFDLAHRNQSVRARSSVSNTSRWSPGLMSLVSARSTPHSMPALTSFTSSLKRRSEVIVVLLTITSSRVRRAWSPLRMTPSRTRR